jgi:2-methylisocitrate lyase-like PEP mutase family enzyme
MKPTAALRQLIEQPGITMAIGVYDPLTARLAQKAGFKLLVISGNAVSASYLGMPDMGFLNLHDIVDVSRRIAAAVDIPVIVDADTGFGNAMNVVRTVRELEGAGTAGIIIEDQIDFKKCGMIERKHPVVPAEEHAAKVRAA